MAKRRGDGESVFDKRFVVHGRGTVISEDSPGRNFFFLFFFFSSLPLLLFLLLKKGLVWTTLSVFQF